MIMAVTRVDTCPVCNGKHLIHRLSYVDDISGKTFEILRCMDCGLHLTQQPPRREEMASFYPSVDDACYKPAKLLCDKWFDYLRGVWNKQQTRIVREEADRLSGVLFEMGSKMGFFANTMRNSGWIVHTVEDDNVAREYANKRFLLQSEDSRRFYDINPCSYNVVVSWDTLGEAVDVHRALDKLSQLIVSDGTIIVAFCDAMIDNVAHYQSNWSGWNAPRKRWHLTAKAFEMLAEQHNLHIVNCRTAWQPALLTAWESEWRASGKKNLWPTLYDAFIRVKKSKNTPAYYIYTLKHKLKR